MLSPNDVRQIEAHGCRPEMVEQQLENFRKGFPFLQLIEAASVFHGVIVLNENEIERYNSIYELRKKEDFDILKFVPASGAATRMFEPLYSALTQLQSGKELNQIQDDVQLFLENLAQFAFYDDLVLHLPFNRKPNSAQEACRAIEALLTEKGLNYGRLPKALLPFHRCNESVRTSIEEHLIEGALYAKNNRNKVRLHFTVSKEHQQAVNELIDQLQPGLESRWGANFEICLSNQKPATDSIAVTPENELLRNPDGSLFFRPAGHGALIENLNDIHADIIFIKNIDNVVPDHLKKLTCEYKKALAGVLLTVQNQLFRYQKLLDENEADQLESEVYAELNAFVEDVLCVSPPRSLLGGSKEDLYQYFKCKINRPVRICGMVKNTGEPGGGPFFALNPDHTVSLQIVEGTQVDFHNPEQVKIFRQATHFNPVDLVCGVKNYKGMKYNLLEFVDRSAGFIARKSCEGQQLKVQELPGLWNGAMSDWNTLFVEVPLETFCPVKTVNDLLRKEHQAE